MGKIISLIHAEWALNIYCYDRYAKADSQKKTGFFGNNIDAIM